MKKTILLAVLFLGIGKLAQSQTVSLNQAELTFQKEVHDYGDIKQMATVPLNLQIPEHRP